MARGAIQSGITETGELASFTAGSFASVPASLNYFSEALRHASMMLRGTLPLMFVMNVFQGASVANLGFSLLRAIGAGDFFGLLTGYVGPRQTATTMFGYVFAAKIGCGITAELGAMRIQQEVDALSSTGVDPRRYLVGTRILAILMFIPVATIVAVLGNVFGAYLVSVITLQGISGNQLMTVHWSVQTMGDYVFALVTMGSVALACGIVSCFYGLRTSGGPAAVGSAVAKGIVVNLVILHLITAMYAAVVYGTDQRLPIGG